jgi:RNA polymerase sigma factor (sigma-70 family)
VGDTHAAEDAFQATWLALVRRAGAVRDGAALAGWLHRVACRVALRVRGNAARRAARERGGVELLAGPGAEAAVPGERRELRAALDEEIDRLPGCQRGAFVLCCLEGKSQAEAARELGRPLGTVSSWLTRARRRLRKALASRGLTPTVAGLAAGATPAAASASIPARLVSLAARAAKRMAAGEVVDAEMVPARVTALAEGAVGEMTTNKLKAALAVLLIAAVLCAGPAVMSKTALTTPTRAVAMTQGGGANAPAKAKLVTAVYQVGDLVTSRALAPPGRPRQTGEAQLIRLITRVVTPGSWQAKGGAGTIDYFPLSMALVVSQTPEVQAQVAELLKALRRFEDAGRVPAAPAAGGANPLEGTWTIVSGDVFRRGERWLIRDGQIRVGKSDKLYQFLSVQPGKGHIDMTVMASPDGQVLYWQHGLYTLEGNRLRVCFAPPGERRPTAFPSKPPLGQVLVLKRVNP